MERINQSNKPWEQQGCEECRKSWEVHAGRGLEALGVSVYRHARLFRCRSCGAYWEESERFAHEIEASEAKEFFAHDPA